MSFILDALRKSEHERQRDGTLGVSRVPTSVPSERLPPWALAVMATLSVLLIGLGYAWWNGARLGPPAQTPIASEPARPRPVAPAEPLASSSLARAQAPVAAPATEPAAASGPPTTAAARSAATAESAPADVLASVPTLAELRSSGLLLPDLELQLHVYGDTRAERFVYINGVRYGEGDAVADGPAIEAITTEGVLLSEQGRQFLLPKN